MTTADNLAISLNACEPSSKSNGEANDFCHEVRRRVAQRFGLE